MELRGDGLWERDTGTGERGKGNGERVQVMDGGRLDSGDYLSKAFGEATWHICRLLRVICKVWGRPGVEAAAWVIEYCILRILWSCELRSHPGAMYIRRSLWEYR